MIVESKPHRKLKSNLKPGTNARKKKTIKKLAGLKSVRSATKEKLSNFISPMLASIHDRPFADGDWIFEIKWDGYRALAELRNGDVKLYSRNGLSFLPLYPKVATALSKLKFNAVLDGEIVVLNRQNRPDFQKLQQYFENQSLPIQYYVFDCLAVNGKPITNLPLIERKKIAKKLIGKNEVIKYSDHVEGDGLSFFDHAARMNLEGIVAKRATSIYEPGKRTRNWLKIKNQNTQEAIIAGFTKPGGSRTFFGSLVLARNENGKLRYLGHTGTGFTNKALKDLYATLKPLIRKTSPFEGRVPVRTSVTWVEPTLVCNVKFTELTADGILRHPVFQGLRIDKEAHEVSTLDKKAETKKNG